MNTDKAYIMGLVIGGGGFSLDQSSFSIRLPFRQWGDVDKNPERAGLIAKDIMQVVKPLLSIEYNLEISYVTGREWKIECYGDVQSLIDDLRKYHIEPTSELHKTADISALVRSLSDINLKKRFIAGVADTIGSMAPSHRRFTDDVQIISFEISGFNYKFVCQLCKLLYEVGCIPDQILWQHPNMQSGTDSYYTSWKKGNKLRVTLDSFSTFGSLAFKSKTISQKENRLLEDSGRVNVAIKCENKTLSVPGVVAVHKHEDNYGIPDEIRGGHYIHHKQICAALHCPHAPYGELDKLFLNAENYISPFTVLHKDELGEINAIVETEPIMKNRKYEDYTIYVSDIIKKVDDGAQTILFSNNGVTYLDSRIKGYPLNVMLDALAFIIASKTGNLNGKRPRGNREEILFNAITTNPTESVIVKVPDLLTPIILTDGKMAAMVGPLNAKVYRRLISFAENNRYKMIIRNIEEEDLKGN